MMTATTTKAVKPNPDVAETTNQSALGARWGHAVDKLASWQVWIASATVFIPFAFVFFASSAAFAVPAVDTACGQAPPDMRFYSTGDDVVSFLDACGPAGRDAYQTMQLADLAYPAVVGLFLASSLALAVKGLSAGNTLRWIVAIPLVAAFFDYLENAFAWLAIASYPEAIVTSDVLGFASAAKTSLSWIAGLTLLGCLAILGVRALRRQMRQHLDNQNPPANRHSALKMGS